MLRSIVMAACMAAMWSNASLAQVTTESPRLASTRGPTAAQRNWLSASPEQRVRIAEQIGDDGARAMAKAKRYQTLFDGFGRSLPQGPDQVYRAADGRVIAFEAKGGSGQLGRGYGYAQGSTEWAVESAKRVLSSFKAGTVEKAAARQVLDAASRGKLEVHVVRTRHVLGEPTVAVQEAVATATDDAVRLANSALDDLARSAGAVVDEAHRTAGAMRSGGAVVNDIAQTARHAKVARTATKALVVVGVAVDAGYRAVDATDVERQYAAGTLTQKQREIEHAANAAGMVGGWGGAIVGVKIGALGGGGAGSVVAPGPGTAIGSAVGGLAGGIAGYIGGEAAAEAGTRWAVRQAHTAGTTITDCANTAAGVIQGGWNWLWGN